MRFRLRHQQQDIELVDGDFVLGRSAECHLSLDDALISRRHALLAVRRDGVTIEDLQSRNGVLVDGLRITGRVALADGATVRIGGQELTLSVLAAGSAAAGGRSVALAQIAQTLPSLSDGQESGPVDDTSSGYDPSTIRRADTFRMLAGVADTAFAMGRAAEAERMLAAPLADVLETSRSGRRVTPALLEQAGRLSAKLAIVTGKAIWADRVIELYGSAACLCPASVLDELYSALHRVGPVDVTRLRAYVEAMRAQVTSYGPADRFLFQRLEGLDRLAALR